MACLCLFDANGHLDPKNCCCFIIRAVDPDPGAEIAMFNYGLVLLSDPYQSRFLQLSRQYCTNQPGEGNISSGNEIDLTFLRHRFPDCYSAQMRDVTKSQNSVLLNSEASHGISIGMIPTKAIPHHMSYATLVV